MINEQVTSRITDKEVSPMIGSKKRSTESAESHGTELPRKSKIWPFGGLQARMTVSYIWVTIVTVFLLGGISLVISSITLPQVTSTLLRPIVAQQSQIYALEAAALVRGTSFDAQITFQPGQAGTLAPPHSTASLGIISLASIANSQSSAFALVIASDGQIIASSDSADYPVKANVSHKLANKTHAITQALKGEANSTAEVDTSVIGIIYAAEPIWNQAHQVVGALYMQERLEPVVLARLYPAPFVGSSIIIGLLLFIVPLIGGLFGTLTTRGVVRRVQRLVTATDLVGNGDYTSQVKITRSDELGQLEQQFNQMTQQLEESMAQRQKLTEQNARLAERARISRELHDAISQDLFSLRMLAYGLQDALPQNGELQPQIAALEVTSTRMMREMRALLLELRPTHLEHLSLAEALAEVAETYGTRLGITVKTELTQVKLSVAVEHALLRVAQEGISNAIRHAHATQITLTLGEHDRSVTMTITDNGSGFNTNDHQVAHGLGLRLMNERIQEIHGIFTLHSAKGQGTRIAVELPEEEAHVASCYR